MTAIRKAMAKAGVNVAESELRQLSYDALKKHHGNVERALPTFENAVGKSQELIREALLVTLRRFAEEMLGGGHGADGGQKNGASAEQPNRGGVTQPEPEHQLPRGRSAAMPGNARRGLSVITSVQSTVRQGLLHQTKTSDGRAWAAVGYHELDGMDRDGAVARLIKRRIGAPPNKFMTLAELLTDQKFQEIIDEARTQNDPS